MNIKSASIITFFELSDEWQSEAYRNIDERAEEAHYLEPTDDTNPEEHILWDLDEAMVAEGSHDGFIYNATIGISNNSAMLLHISEDGEIADYIFV